MRGGLRENRINKILQTYTSRGEGEGENQLGRGLLEKSSKQGVL